jgi:hypothetical protein
MPWHCQLSVVRGQLHKKTSDSGFEQVSEHKDHIKIFNYFLSVFCVLCGLNTGLLIEVNIVSLGY